MDSDFKAFAQGKVTSFTKSAMFRKELKKLFEEADLDNSGTIEKEETYTLVLKLYIFVAQYTTIHAATVPSRKETHELFDKMDIDGSETLDFEEFEAIAIVLLEGVAVKLSFQVLVKSVLGPALAVALVSLFHYCAKFRNYNMEASLPQWIPDYVFSDVAGVMVTTSLLNAFFLPRIIDYYEGSQLKQIDEDKIKEPKKSKEKERKQVHGDVEITVNVPAPVEQNHGHHDILGNYVPPNLQNSKKIN